MPHSKPAFRRLLWQRRVDAARVWQEATRREAAEHSEAVRRILQQASQTPDPVRSDQRDTADEPATKPGPELALANRRLSAERWPPGALETCEKIEAEHPGWWAYYREANKIKGFEHPAGFAAYNRATQATVCGADAGALAVAIGQAPQTVSAAVRA